MVERFFHTECLVQVRVLVSAQKVYPIGDGNCLLYSRAVKSLGDSTSSPSAKLYQQI